MKKVLCIILALVISLGLCACGAAKAYTVTSKDGTVGEYSMKELKKLKDDAIAFDNVVSGSVISGEGKITKIESSSTFAGQWANKSYYTIYINDEVTVRIRSEFASDFRVGDTVSFEGRYYGYFIYLELLPVNDNFDNPSPSVFK